jgi:hypothetical protein
LETRGEHVESKRGTLSVIEAFQNKMEEVIAAEQNEEQKKILMKALERGLLALQGKKDLDEKQKTLVKALERGLKSLEGRT